MNAYRVSPITEGSSWKVYGWKIEKETLFGVSKLSTYAERQEAIENAKRICDKNRPSKVRIYNNKGVVVSKWEYGERPRVG